MGKTIASVGIDLGASALHVDSLLSIGKGIFHFAEILQGTKEQRSQDEAMERSFSRAEAVFSDLKREFKPNTLTSFLPGDLYVQSLRSDYDAAKQAETFGLWRREYPPRIQHGTLGLVASTLAATWKTGNTDTSTNSFPAGWSPPGGDQHVRFFPGTLR